MKKQFFYVGMSLLLIAAIISSGSAKAIASSSAPGTLNTLHFFYNGIVLVYTTGASARTNIPSCGVVSNQRFAIDTSTSGGKVLLSGLLSAYNSGKQVVIIGAENCSVFPDTESISYFYTVD